MFAPATQSRSLERLAIIAVVLQALLGCQNLSERAVPSQLDPRTGVTVSIANDVLVFARTENRYSRSARDYLYLGPVEINRQGLREYFLWVGVATTLDRGYLAPEADSPAMLQLMLGEEPMEFKLRPWNEIAPQFSSQPSYETHVAPYLELGARVTRDQIRLLEDARTESLRVTAVDSRTRLYRAWQNEVRWSGFLARGN